MEIKPPLPEVPLPARFGQALGIVATRYTALIERLLLPHGLTWAQFTVLVHLARRADPARIADITRAVDLTQPAVTKIVQKFSGLGWVTQDIDPQDQRNRPVALTPEGRQVVQRIQQGFGPEFAALMDGWSPPEAERLIADLMRLAGRIDSMTPGD